MVALLVTVAFMLVVLLIKFVTRSKQRKPAPSKEIAARSGLYVFPKAEVEKAISFKNERKSLGRGSAGHVYKGILPSGQAVAIKHMNKSSKSDSFTRELQGLSRVQHPNLVSLFGYCVEGGEQYLVYAYCPAGNLAQHLSTKQSSPSSSKLVYLAKNSLKLDQSQRLTCVVSARLTFRSFSCLGVMMSVNHLLSLMIFVGKNSALTWERRVKILRDCARALRYLHHHVDGCIVHRDVKVTRGPEPEQENLLGFISAGA